MTRRWVMLVLSVVIIASLACSALPGGGATAIATAPSGLGATANATAGAGSSTEARTATVSEINNTVDARETESADWQTANVGQALAEGGGVRTGDDSRAKVDLSPDNSILRIAPNTEFKLTTFSPEPTDPVTKLVLDAGKLFARVTKALGGGEFEIETPSGVATVRGSLMSAAYSRADGRMIVTCLEGECRLSDAARTATTDLREGEASEIPGAGRGPLAARRMDEAEFDDWLQNFPELQDVIERLRRRQEPTPTPPGGGGAAGGGLTACDHPYFPLRPGATWTYSTESGATTWTVSSVTGDTTSASAEVTFAFEQGTVTWHFQCDASGITSYDFGAISSTELGQVVVFNVTSQSGVLIPAAELLAPGYSWTNAYELQMEFTIPGQDQQISSANARTEDLVVTGAEPVTVGGETFDGLLISFNGTSTIQMQVPGVEVPPTTTSDSGTWTLARGVGIVMSTSQSEGFSSQSTLTSYHIP